MSRPVIVKGVTGKGRRSHALWARTDIDVRPHAPHDALIAEQMGLTVLMEGGRVNTWEIAHSATHAPWAPTAWMTTCHGCRTEVTLSC